MRRADRPERFERTEQITVAYGHGLAVAPIQFAAAVAALINGGKRVEPTFLRRFAEASPDRPRVVRETSAKINELLRRNVTDAHGTGKRGEVPGYRVGGKTGTAEMPGRGGYREKAVIASFLAAFPMDAPKYLVLVSLFEPKGTQETAGEILAGMNAAPTAAASSSASRRCWAWCLSGRSRRRRSDRSIHNLKTLHGLSEHYRYNEMIGADGGTRTLTGLPPQDFKSSYLEWCERPDLNRHVLGRTRGFKPLASTVSPRSLLHDGALFAQIYTGFCTICRAPPVSQDLEVQSRSVMLEAARISDLPLGQLQKSGIKL